MKLVPGNAQHIGARQQQQDAFGFSNLDDPGFRGHGGVLAVVADGMGGMAYGDAAAKAAVKSFLEAYAAKAESESIPDALVRCILAANAAVFETATKLGTAGDTGTTLIATVVQEQNLYWISAGDSGIFLWRDGEFTLVNDTHVYAHELDARVWLGQISHHVAQGHPEREALTSFLGLERIPMVDRSRRGFRLQPSDVVMLASDGLFKTLSLPEMAVPMDQEPQPMAESLVERALAAKNEYQDNVTVLVLKLDPEAPVAPLTNTQKNDLRSLRAPAPSIQQPAEPVLPPPPPPPPPPIPAVVAAPVGKAEALRPPVVLPSRRSKPRLSLRVILLAVALVLAGGYAYYMISYDPTANPAVPPALPERSGSGQGFDVEKAPPLQRQPGQEPAPDPPPQP